MSLDQKAFEKHINEKWTNKVCPMCGGNNWTYDATMATPLTIGPGKTINLGGKILPLVPVTCSNCGNTIFVNALVAKAFIDDGDDKKDGD